MQTVLIAIVAAVMGFVIVSSLKYLKYGESGRKKKAPTPLEESKNSKLYNNTKKRNKRKKKK